MTNIQIPSTLLEACVLSLLSDQPAYGYSLTQTIKDSLEVSESTLYPVLRRLETESLLSTYDEPETGRLRRYYALTDQGRAELAAIQSAWKTFKRSIDKTLKRKKL